MSQRESNDPYLIYKLIIVLLLITVLTGECLWIPAPALCRTSFLSPSEISSIKTILLYLGIIGIITSIIGIWIFRSTTIREEQSTNGRPEEEMFIRFIDTSLIALSLIVLISSAISIGVSLCTASHATLYIPVNQSTSNIV